MKKLVIIIYLLIAVPCLAAEWTGKTARYIDPTNGNDGNGGTSWSDARATLPTTLTRDYVYYMAEGDHAGYDLDTANSGTDYIYIVHATADDHGTETGWSDSMGDEPTNFSGITMSTDYWWIDGQMGGGPGDWNGTYGFRFRYTANVSSNIITISGARTRFYVRHVDLSYDYNADYTWGSQANAAVIADSQDAIYGLGGISYFTLSYCRVNQPGRTAILSRGVWDEIIIEYTRFNEITFDALEGAEASVHGELWSASQSSGSVSDTIIRYNYIYKTRSSGTFVMANTYRTYWYGNIFELADTNPTQGVIGNWTDGQYPDSGDAYVYNNTFINGGGELGLVGSWNTSFAYNNLFYDVNHRWEGFTHDYNASDEDISETNDQTISSAIFTTYPTDLTLSGATDAGKDVTQEVWWDANYCSTEDMNGNTWGADGNWDRGAFEFSSSGTADNTQLGSGTPVDISDLTAPTVVLFN